MLQWIPQVASMQCNNLVIFCAWAWSWYLVHFVCFCVGGYVNRSIGFGQGFLQICTKSRRKCTTSIPLQVKSFPFSQEQCTFGHRNRPPIPHIPSFPRENLPYQRAKNLVIHPIHKTPSHMQPIRPIEVVTFAVRRNRFGGILAGAGNLTVL